MVMDTDRNALEWSIHNGLPSAGGLCVPRAQKVALWADHDGLADLVYIMPVLDWYLY